MHTCEIWRVKSANDRSKTCPKRLCFTTGVSILSVSLNFENLYEIYDSSTPRKKCKVIHFLLQAPGGSMTAKRLETGPCMQSYCIPFVVNSFSCVTCGTTLINNIQLLDVDGSTSSSEQIEKQLVFYRYITFCVNDTTICKKCILYSWNRMSHDGLFMLCKSFLRKYDVEEWTQTRYQPNTILTY